MSQPRVLIVYGTNYGQTARIAARIRRHLHRLGVVATVWKGDSLPAEFDPSHYDGIIVGASMIRHGYQKYVRDFVKRYLSTLNALPSAFFAVSGSAGSSNAGEREVAHRSMIEFCRTSGWHPGLTASMAGAIAYTKYSWLLRIVMKRISAKEGASTDTTRDHEYTNWNQVEQFAREFADQLETARTPAFPRTG